MNRATRVAALAAAGALTCTASPAFADDGAYTTEGVQPSWTAASAESCADPDTAPLLSSFDDDDLYAPAPGGTFDTGAGGWQLESLDEDSDVRVEVVYPGLAKDNVRKAKDLKAKHGRGWSLSGRIKLNPTHGLKQGG